MQINDLLNDPKFWESACSSIMGMAERQGLIGLVNYFREHSEKSIRHGSSMVGIIGATIPGASSHCMGFLLGIKAILDFQQAQEHSPSAIEIRELEKMMGMGGEGNDPQI